MNDFQKENVAGIRSDGNEVYNLAQQINDLSYEKDEEIYRLAGELIEIGNQIVGRAHLVQNEDLPPGEKKQVLEGGRKRGKS